PRRPDTQRIPGGRRHQPSATPISRKPFSTVSIGSGITDIALPRAL
ncbi:hypothetical protein ACUXPF_003976, partial [Sphingomonas sanguinis]